MSLVASAPLIVGSVMVPAGLSVVVFHASSRPPSNPRYDASKVGPPVFFGSSAQRGVLAVPVATFSGEPSVFEIAATSRPSQGLNVVPAVAEADVVADAVGDPAAVVAVVGAADAVVAS